MRAHLHALLLLVLLALGLAPSPATAGATFQPAPEVVSERPSVPAPPGGWWTEDGLYARVHGVPEDRDTVRRLADHAARSVPALSARLGVAAGGVLDVYLAPDVQAFARMQPGEPPEWADGTAWPAHGLVFLRAPSARPGTARPLEQVLDHELVHVLLGRAFAPQPSPRWLQEGLARFFAGESGPEDAETLFTARLGGEITLARATAGFHRDALSAQAAYAASADLVAYVAGKYGEDALRRLIAEMSLGRDVEQALSRATGVEASQVEAAWKARWDGPLPWLRAIAREEVFWGLAAALFAYGAIRARARKRRRLARWEAEEKWIDTWQAPPSVH